MSTGEMTFTVGDGLLGRVIDAAGRPADGGGPLVGVRPAMPRRAGEAAPDGPIELWETGVKAIDFYAPIRRGGTVALVGSPGVGLVVQVAELTHRLAARGGCGVIADLDDEAAPVRDTAGGLREAGVMKHVALMVAAPESPAAERRSLALGALAAAEDFCERGRDVLLVLDDGLATPETAGALRERLRRSERGSLTLLLCLWRHTAPEPSLAPEVEPLLRGADARIALSRALGKQGVWPAVDGLASGSRLLDADAVGEKHAAAARGARELLRLVGEGEVDARAARARRVLLYGSQPFFVAEPYTARPGVFVPYAETVRAYAGLVAGAYDSVPEEALRFAGVLEAR
jgi:F-type H+/Na+-transporting ATPase subunit beta